MLRILEQTPFNNLPTPPDRIGDAGSLNKPDCIHTRLEIVEGSPVGLKEQHQPLELDILCSRIEVSKDYPAAPSLVEEEDMVMATFFLRCCDCQREWMEFKK